MKKVLSNHCPHGQQSSCALSVPMVSSPVVLYQSLLILGSDEELLKGLEQEVDDNEETGRWVSVLLPLCMWSAVECCDLWQSRFLSLSFSACFSLFCCEVFSSFLSLCDWIVILSNVMVFSDCGWRDYCQVGCGAIGCEMLKNYALLGVGTNQTGQVISRNECVCVCLCGVSERVCM